MDVLVQEDLWFRTGDVVPCKVEWSNARGARVSTLRDPRIIGYGLHVGCVPLSVYHFRPPDVNGCTQTMWYLTLGMFWEL